MFVFLILFYLADVKFAGMPSLPALFAKQSQPHVFLTALGMPHRRRCVRAGDGALSGTRSL